MRIFSWNTAHQTNNVPLEKAFWPALKSLRPAVDVLCFNEYVHGEFASEVWTALARHGFAAKNVAISARFGRCNQVLVAARRPFEEGELVGPYQPHARSNFLHVDFQREGIEVVAMRVPCYEKAAAAKSYWDEFIDITDSVIDRRILFIGDLNANPSLNTPGGRALRELRQRGWQITPTARDAWSFAGNGHVRTAIDFALLAPGIQHFSSEYVSDLGGQKLAGAKGSLSDHAALLLEVD